MKTNDNALAFAATVNDNDPKMPKGRGDCFDFGQFYGCRSNCPVFARGECTLEDPQAMAKMVNEDMNLSPEDVEDIALMYSKNDEFIKHLNP